MLKPTLQVREFQPTSSVMSVASMRRQSLLTLDSLTILGTLLIYISPVRAAPDTPSTPFEKKLVAIESPRDSASDTCLNCFFKKGATDDMFSGRAELAKPPEIQILRPISGKSEEEPPSAQEPQISPRDRIAREFGGPEEEDKILGDEKAPKAFRGMMHAIEAGDKELAFDYARRYTRYINKLKDRTLLVTNLAGLGAEIDGFRPRLDHSEDSDPSGYLEIYQKKLDQTVKNESAILSLNPEAQAILARARKEEQGGALIDTNGANGEASSNQPLGEAAERAMVYKNHQSPLPVDPQGRVNLFLFLSTADLGPHSMIGDIQRLKDRYEKDDKVVIKGVSLVPEVNQIVSTMQRFGLKVTFPIEENRELANELGITHTPAVVVMAPSTGDYVLEKGHRTIWYLEELIGAVRGKAMSGKRKSGDFQ